MIDIVIGEPNALANNVLVEKSAFVSFEYNSDIVTYIQQMSTRKYNPDTRTWEMPIQNIIGLCNHFKDVPVKISGMYETLVSSKRRDSIIPASFKFKTKPYQHQIDGVKFGLNQKKFILGDEQGLGKTKQIIDLANCLGDKIKHVLIVCGVNTLKYNWETEVSIHSDEKAFVLGTRYRKNGNRYEGSLADKLSDLENIPDAKFIITNVETLRGGKTKEGKKNVFPVVDAINKLVDAGEISMIALDECHKCKDPTSLQGQAMIRTHAEYMVAMSGTPLMNNPLDLFFPLYWLGYETHSYFQFKSHYCTMGGYGGYEVVGYKNLDEIREILSQVMIRRLKTEVLDLPEKIHQTEYVDMTPKQEIIYKEALAGVMANINQIKFSNNPLAMLIRLRQATGYTGILSDKVKESAKLDRMEELVEELTSSGQKAIIFSNWTEVTSVVKERLKKYNPAYIAGEVKADDRMSEVNRFQNDSKCKVIIGTTGAMGTGLTLTAAQTVIFLDSPWNRALKDQAEDRCHRIGTKGTVNVITICCKNTIDERIEDIVYRKGLMSDMLVDGKGGKIDMSIINMLIS